MKLLRITAALFFFTCAAMLCRAQLPQPDGGPIRPGTLPRSWRTGGPKCMEQPEWQVHEYNPDLYLLRQSGCTDFEKPFLFLFFGKDRALLLDTGSRKGDLAPTLARTVHNWLTRNNRASIPLTVVHTHPHEDHIFGDAELQALHDTAIPITLIPADLASTKHFYHMDHWPEDPGSIDPRPLRRQRRALRSSNSDPVSRRLALPRSALCLGLPCLRGQHRTHGPLYRR